MSIEELQKYTYFSKYARYKKEEKRRETWEEAVDRMKQMHLKRYPQVKEEIDWAFNMVQEQKVLGSQRALQFGGEPIEKHNEKIYNCTASHCDRLRFFQEVLFLLLNGSGTGFSVQKHHVAKLPNFTDARIKNIKLPIKEYIIPDSIEGWSDSLGVLLSSYFESPVFQEYSDCEVKFDFSKIRPEGSYLSSSSGKAPGPKPLIRTLNKIKELLDKCITNNQIKLRPIDAYDIVMHSSDAVLSGGVRRCIAEGSKVLVKGESFKSIEDVKIGDYVSTNDGYQKVINVFEQGKQETIKIKHQNGILKCTKNHRVAVLKNHKGEFVWKQAGELNTNDILMFVRNVDMGANNNKLPSFNYEKPLHSTTCKNIVIPELDREMAYFIGYFHGNGYVYLTSKAGSLSIAVPSDNYNCAILISEQIKRFGVNAKITGPWPKDDCYKIVVKSKQLGTYIYNNFKQPKTVIRIPNCIKQGNVEIRAAYLQGVFDSDGSIKTRPEQVVSTVYKEFAREIQQLYYSLGIITRVKKDSKNQNENWKQKYLVHILNKRDKEEFNNLNFKFGSKKFKFKQNRIAQSKLPISYFELLDKPKAWWKKVCKDTEFVYMSHVEHFYGKQNYCPSIIQSIEHGNIEQTYDLEVENNHCFVCEGVLVHNSACLSMFSKDDEEMLKAKTGNWYYENPQRARSNNSALFIRNELTKAEFNDIIENTRQFGEPGFIFSDSTEMILNPCCFHPETRLATKNGLIKISELSEKYNNVTTDLRVGKKDKYDKDNFGSRSRVASQVILTQKNADIYELITEHGHTLKITSNHKFPTPHGRKELHELKIGDILLLQSGEGQWGGLGYYEDGRNLAKESLEQVPDSVWIGSRDYVIGYLHGVFENCILKFSRSAGKTNIQDILRSILECKLINNKKFISDIQILLNNFGIVSKIKYENEKYELILDTSNLITYNEKLGLFGRIGNKFDALLRLKSVSGENEETYLTKIKSIIKLQEKSDVFCLEEPVTNCVIANGVVTGQCEIGMYPVDIETGLSGFQGCNLSEINGKLVKTKEDFNNAAIAASIIGTLQAGYTDFPYLGEVSERIFRREALLGVSITGMMDNPDILFNPEYQKEAAELVKNTNAKIAKLIGINPAARLTAIKPSGCQKLETLLITEQGILNFSEIGNINGKTWQDHSIKIKVNNGENISTKFYINGKSKTKILKMQSGLELESTLNHKYEIFDGDKLIWKEMDDIEIGDLIPYQIGGYEKFDINPIRLKKIIPDKHKMAHSYILMDQPDILDESLAWFIGCYTGDGSNHKRSVRIHGNKTDLFSLENCQRIIKEKFGLDSKIILQKSSNRAELYINSSMLLQWLKENGLSKNKSLNIDIPLNIRKSPLNVIKSFIDGYWNADGCTHKKNKTRNWVTISKTMAQQLVVVLRAIGQDASVRNMPPTNTSKGVNMRYWIQEKKGRKGNIKYSSLGKEYKLLDAANLNHLTPDKVVGITYGECDTYDIEVPEGHSYIANSYSSHNTASSLLGCASGVHLHHSKRYMRRVQANRLEVPFKVFSEVNSHAVEDSAWSSNKTDSVISFCCEIPDNAKTKSDMSAVEFLSMVKLTQDNWIQSGKNSELCTQPWLSHNVSNTVNVKNNEWDDVADYIYDNKESFTAVSLLSTTGDLDYTQAPFCAVLTPEEIEEKYGLLAVEVANNRLEDILEAFNGNLWFACDVVINNHLIKDLDREQQECIEKLLNFAKDMFNDIKLATYCLKDIHNWNMFSEIKKNYKSVDYTNVIEETDQTKLIENVACSGGACEIF